MRFPLLRANQPDSTNRKIFRAALAVGLIGLLVRGALTVKELAVARWFGRGDALDTFLIAFVLPSFVVNLVMGALSSSLVPVLVETRQKRGAEAANRLLSTLAVLCLAALIAVALLLGVLAPFYLPWLGSSFSAAKLQLTREMLYWLLPWMVASGFALFASAVLNAGERFAVPSLVPVLTPLATIAFIVLAAARWGAFTLATGTLAGGLLEAVVLVYVLNRREARVKLRWGGLDPGVRSVLRQFVPMLAGAFLMGSTTVVDQSMAAMLSSGSVAALNYGSKITGAILTTVGLAVSTAALPYFSRMIADNDGEGCRHTLKRYSLLAAAVTVPLTLLLIAFSRPLVRLLFQRGAFTAADTALVAWVQVCYALQIPFFVLGMLFVRFLSAARRNHLLLYASALNLVVDIVLNLVLMRIWGVAGIALATSIVFLVSCTFVCVCSLRVLSRERLVLTAPVEAGGAPS